MHHPHAFRSLAEQKRSVGFPETDETSVSSELDDHLAHLADGACRGAHWLWEGDGQEVRVESGNFHTRLSYGRRPLLNTPGALHPELYLKREGKLHVSHNCSRCRGAHWKGL